jgi:hypothetical protein
VFEIRIRGLEALVGRFAQLSRQVPFATSKAINVTLNQGQEAMRRQVEGEFTLRRPTFILNTIKIAPGDRATKAKLVGTIRIDPDRDFLAPFEKGGTKRPIAGKSLAVPAEGLPRKRSDVIPARLRPKALDLTVHRTRTGKVQFKGQQRTFIVEKSTFNYGILQRVGRGKGSRVMVLYWFQRSVEREPILRFEKTLREVVNRNWDKNLADAMDLAIRTAR